MCVSFGIATSIMSPSFVFLSITTKSGLQACICLSTWSWSPTVPWLYCSLLLGWSCGARCYLSVWSCSAGICSGGLLLLCCYVLSCTSFLLCWGTLTMWATVSSFSLHILHFGSFVMWSIFAFWHLMSSASSCTAVMSTAVSLLSPVFSRVHL